MGVMSYVEFGDNGFEVHSFEVKPGTPHEQSWRRALAEAEEREHTLVACAYQASWSELDGTADAALTEVLLDESIEFALRDRQSQERIRRGLIREAAKAEERICYDELEDFAEGLRRLQSLGPVDFLHDSISVEVREEDAERAQRLLVGLMAVPAEKYEIKLPAEPASRKLWDEK